MSVEMGKNTTWGETDFLAGRSEEIRKQLWYILTPMIGTKPNTEKHLELDTKGRGIFILIRYMLNDFVLFKFMGRDSGAVSKGGHYTNPHKSTHALSTGRKSSRSNHDGLTG